MGQGNNTVKTVASVLLGMAIGSAIGILFAPMKGCDIRKKILSKGDDFTNDMKDKFDSFISDIKNEYEITKGKTKDFVDEKLS